MLNVMSNIHNPNMNSTCTCISNNLHSYQQVHTTQNKRYKSFQDIQFDFMEIADMIKI